MRTFRSKSRASRNKITFIFVAATDVPLLIAITVLSARAQMGGLSVLASKCARCFRDVWLASSRAFELGLALLSRIHPDHVLGGSADRADRRNVRLT